MLQPAVPGLEGGFQYRPSDSKVATARVLVDGRLLVGGAASSSGGGGGGGVVVPPLFAITIGRVTVVEGPVSFVTHATAFSVCAPSLNLVVSMLHAHGLLVSVLSQVLPT